MTWECVFVDFGDLHVFIEENYVYRKLHVFGPELRALIESVNKEHACVFVEIWSVG